LSLHRWAHQQLKTKNENDKKRFHYSFNFK